MTFCCHNITSCLGQNFIIMLNKLRFKTSPNSYPETGLCLPCFFLTENKYHKKILSIVISKRFFYQNLRKFNIISMGNIKTSCSLLKMGIKEE